MKLPIIFVAILCSLITFTAVAAQLPGPVAPAPANLSDEAVLDLAYKQLSRRLTEQAIGNFQQVLQRDSASVRAQLGLGLAQQAAGRNAQAIIEYERTLNLDPNNQIALREVGRLYTYQEPTWERAIDRFQKYLSLQPADQKTRLLLAQVLSWAEQHDAAEREARQVLQQQPSNNEARLLLAQVLAWQGNGPAALPLFTQLVRAGKLPPAARKDYALALRQTGRFDEAEKIYNRLLIEQPATQIYKAELARLIDERARVPVAPGTAAGRQAAGNYTAEQQAILERARVLHRQGETEAAIPLYRRVLAQRANDLKLRLEFADILGSMPVHRPEALALLEAELKQRPSRDLQLHRAKLLSWMPDRRAEALSIYLNFYRQNPADQSGRQALIQTLIWSDPTPTLIGLLREMLQVVPSNAALRLQLAQALIRQRDYTTAIAELETILRADPNHWDARLALAEAYHNTGQTAKAQEELQRILSVVSAPQPPQ